MEGSTVTERLGLSLIAPNHSGVLTHWFPLPTSRCTAQPPGWYKITFIHRHSDPVHKGGSATSVLAEWTMASFPTSSQTAQCSDFLHLSDDSQLDGGNLPAPVCFHRKGLPGRVTEETRPRVAQLPQVSARAVQADVHPGIPLAMPPQYVPPETPQKNSQELHEECSTPKPLYTGEAVVWRVTSGWGHRTGQRPAQSPRPCLSKAEAISEGIKPAII